MLCAKEAHISFYNLKCSYILEERVYILMHLRYIMEHEYVPYIKIGSGTTNFYTNLCRAYLKNHNQICVIGGGYKINTALSMYFQLKKEYFVHELQHLCVHYYRMHSMCSFSVSINEPINELTVEESDNNIIKIDNIETVSQITHRCKNKLNNTVELHLIGVGQACVKVFFVASQLALFGYYSYVYPVTITPKNKTSVKIKVYKPY